MRYILIIAALFCSLPQIFAQNNIAYGAGISYTNGAPSFTPPARTSRVAIDTITGKWYHYNTPGGWQLLGNTIEEIAGCSAPAYTPTKGDSKVVINNCANPELYYWTGSAWVWINEGTTYYAGEGIRIQNDSIILDSLYYLQFRTSDTTDLDAGRLSWNAQEGTLDVVINSGNVTGQVFEDVFFNCKNQTGSTITRGTVVMAVGTLGASGRILIAPAIADGSVNSEYILGTAAQDIANGSDGLVYHFGKDRGLNTTGASCGETWADRDVLYCSATTPGCLTKVLPTAPNLKVPVAFVIRAGNNGTLFIRPSHFPDLNQINDVQLTSPTTGQTLIYNASTGVWSNQTPADPSSTNELQTLSVAANTATLSNGGGSVTIAGAGINTVGTAGTTITVTGTEVDGSVSNELQTLSTGTNTLTLSNGGGTVTVDTDPASDVTGSGSFGWVPFWIGGQSISGNNLFVYDNTNARLAIGTSSPGNATLEAQSSGLCFGRFRGGGGANQGSAFYFSKSLSSTGTLMAFGDESAIVGGTPDLSSMIFTTANIPLKLRLGGGSVPQITFLANGRQLINTQTDDGFNLNVNGTGRFANNLSLGTTSSSARLHVVGSGSTSTTWTAQFHNSAGNNNALMIRDDGNVGIGTSAPTSRLTVSGRIEQINLGSSVFIGQSAGLNDDLSANNNVFIGTLAGRDNTTGNRNHFIGSSAGISNTIGANNFYLGSESGFAAIGANNNVSIGVFAGRQNINGDDNLNIGTNSGRLNVVGSENVSIGTESNYSMTQGERTIGIGYRANRYISSGAGNSRADNSIFIGWDARPLDSVQTNQVVIGYQGRGLGSNTTRIGNSSTAQTHLDGSLTLGDATLDASAVLDISSTTRGVLFPRMTTAQRNLIATPADGLVIYNTTDNKLQVRAAGAWVDLH